MLLKYSFAFLKHGSLWTYRLATYGVLIAGLGFVALVFSLRYLVLPSIDDYREPIARAISQAAGQRVSIGGIVGSWQGYHPELKFLDVRIHSAGAQPALSLDRVEAVVSWISLLAGEIRFQALEVHEPQLLIRRDAAGALWIAGIAAGSGGGGGGRGVIDWLLAQRQITVRDARITWLDETRGAPALVLKNVNFRLDNDRDFHRFGLSGTPPAEVASALTVRGELAGDGNHDLQAWQGRLYAEIGYANLVQAQTWIALPMELSRGMGSLRLWMQLARSRISGVLADVQLVNVQTRLGPDLPELELASVQGRLGWNRVGARTELTATGLGFSTAGGLRLAPMQVSYAYTDAPGGVRRCDLRLLGLDLAPAVQLAEFLPLDPALRAYLARTVPAGLIDEAQLSWEGAWDTARPYVARARFSGLALRPDGSLPGFQGLSGQLDANERGGTVALNARNAGIELPKVFSAPLPLDFLSAEADWIFQDGGVRVALKSVTFTNEHLAGNVFGSYVSEPRPRGSIDLTGTLVRGDARQVWRYLPVSAPKTQAWLKRALLAGESRDVRLRLKGPLRDFPFADEKTGLFEVVSKVTGAAIQFAEGWPPVSGIAGDLIVRGNRIEIRPQSGSLPGLRLSSVQVSIADLGLHDEHLRGKGVAEGPTSEFLRFVAESPVSRYIRGFTDKMTAQGDARLELELDLPLHRIKDSTVAGELRLRDNQINVDPRIPPLEELAARIAFTRSSVSIKDGRARLLGTPIAFDAAKRDDGAMSVNLSGSLNMEALHTVSTQPALALLKGETAWRGSIGWRDKSAVVRFDTSLAGVESGLPPPFSKSAQASLPVAVEWQEGAGRQSVLSITVDKVAAAQLALDGNDPDGLRRGAVHFGGPPALLPPADGLWVRGRLESVDVEAWRKVLGTGRGRGVDLAGINLDIGSLDVARRRFHELKIDAARQGTGWKATLAGREVAGEVTWSSGEDAQVVARLKKLLLPAPVTSLQAAGAPDLSDEPLPSVDLAADNFNVEGKSLGRLSLLADREATGWRLQRLDIVNPDSRLQLKGRWTTGVRSRTDVSVRLDVNDIGKFFTRFGWPDAVNGGTAVLEGPVAWEGSPTRLDVPSLSGKIRLEAKNGRFRQIEPGVAKLLGILSLQALPKRVTLDFKDVFSKGFTFDRISANANIVAGVATTEDFVMDGSSALVAMRGQVDLAAETQNLNVRVTPALSESIAVAGAIVNPMVGLTALLAQKALKDPIGQIASFEYGVTGAWANPQVARVSKGAPAAADQPARVR